MDAPQLWEAETAEIEAPGSVGVCGDPEMSWCLAGEEDASIVFEAEVGATANICISLLSVLPFTAALYTVGK